MKKRMYVLLAIFVTTHSTALVLVDYPPKSDGLSLEDTLRRFYIIQRIDPCIVVIKSIRPTFWSFPVPLFDYDKVHYDGIPFCNEHILGLIETLKKEQSIAPLLNVWGEIKRYKYLHDGEMIKEFMQLVFIVTRHSLKHQFPEDFKEERMVKNIYIINTLSSLNLDQILDMLDVLVDDLPAFIQKYELDSKMSWKQWLDKYWLVAPVAFGALLGKMYFDYTHLQKSQNQKK